MTAAAGHRALYRGDAGTVVLTQSSEVPENVDGIVVAPTVVGICGTDLQILRGERSDPSRILGHEGLAEVVTGGQWGFHRGQRVVLNPTDAQDPSFLLGHAYEGMLQERLVVPSRAVQHGLVVPFDEAVPELLSTLVEPLAAVLYSAELLESRRPLRSLAIFGTGVIGMLHAIRARSSGVDAQLIHKPGAKRRLDAWRVAGISLGEVERYRGRFDAAVVCTSRRDALASVVTALTLVRDGGTIDLFGGIADGDRVGELPVPDLNAVRRANTGGVGRTAQPAQTTSGKHIDLVGHRGVARTHLLAAMHELASRPLEYGAIVTHVASMEAAARLLSRFGTGGPRETDDGEPWLKLAIDFRLVGDVVRPGPIASHR